jgi:hypothetical protein
LTRISKRHALGIVGVFVASFLFLGLAMDRTINVFDEGIVLTDAMRVRAGEVVHRDFYTLYGPGAYFVVAALFEWSAAQFAIARVYGVVVVAGIATLTYVALAGRTRILFAFAATVACAVLLLGSASYLYPAFPSLLLALAGSLLLISQDGRKRPGTLLAAGACTGLSAYVRYDSGIVVLVAHFIAIGLLDAMNARGFAWFRRTVRAALLYGLGSACVFLPGLIAFLRVAPASTFIEDVVGYSAKNYVRMRETPFPDWHALRIEPEQMAVYLPILAVAFGALAIAMARRVGDPRSAGAIRGDVASLTIFTVLSAILFYKGIVRVSNVHMLMSIVPALIVLALCADAWWTRRGPMRAAALVAIGLTVAPAVATLYTQWQVYRPDPSLSVAGWLLLKAGFGRPDTRPVASCVQPPAMWLALQTYDHAAVSHYLRVHTAPDERIFVGLERHDLIFANSVALYFASERLPATHWHQLDPGLETRADIQSKMIDELRTQKTRWVVRDAYFDGVREPNQSSVSSGVHLLDDYLDTHYRPVAASGKVSIWLADEVPAPTADAGEACMPRVLE